MIRDHSFALCLTHDLDRPYKSFRSVYYAARDRRVGHLRDLLPGRNPYWQFENIMSLERELDVRSAFYVLNEPHLLEKEWECWLNPGDWVQHLGRYDIRNPDIADVIRALDAGGWEIGLHGSYRSHTDVDRLREEKAALEDLVQHPVVGGRQHYLHLRRPDTWHHHAAIGLCYDSSLGSNDRFGFQHGYRPIRPFDDDFIVFPLTVMESTLPDPGSSFEAAWSACEHLLDEAATHNAVMTVVWHPRYFSETDFPGYRRLYRRLITRALELGAWVGPPRECYRNLDLDRDCVAGTPRKDDANKGGARMSIT